MKNKAVVCRCEDITEDDVRQAIDEGYTDLEELRKKHGEVKLISAGSSLKFCMVAEGKADVYPRLGATMEWDIAAGHIIVSEVGKKMQCYPGNEEIVYNKENLRNGWFVVE